MLATVELRKAIPNDFKIDQWNLKLNQPYVILDDDGHVMVFDVIREDLDVHIFARFIKDGKVYVPLEDYKLKNFIKEVDDETI